MLRRWATEQCARLPDQSRAPQHPARTVDRKVLATIHAAGIPTQASLSPLLPCNPLALAALVDPHCDWVTVQPFHGQGCGARTWTPARQIIAADGWEDWLEGGSAVTAAMDALRRYFGRRFHEGREGFSVSWV